MAGISLSVIPGEALVTALLEYATVHRSTMSEANRNRFDNVQLEMMEDWMAFWKSLRQVKGEKP